MADGCHCYEWLGFFVFWGAITWLLVKLAKGLWTCGLANALGQGYKWKPGTWAVITGSTDGIGLEYAAELAKKGYSLLLISRSQEKLTTTQELIKSKAPKCKEIRTLAIDFSKNNVYGAIEAEIGKLPGEVDVLINNVGVSYCTPEYFGQLSVTNPPDFADTLINVNIISATKMIQLVLPRMEKQKSGLIINVSSLSAAYPTPLLSIYGASKIYVDFLARGLAAEYADKGIVIQSVLPSYVATKMSKIRKTSLLVPSASAYVKAALQTVGVEERTYGYWSHKLQGFVTDQIIVALLGVGFYSGLALSSLKKIRTSYYHKKLNKEE